jgi:hypothetical protein
MRSTARRVAVILAAPALTLSALGAVSSPASAAVDPGPATAASAWLAGQVPDGGLFTGEFGTDYGLSIDVALGLHATGDQEETVSDITDAVASDVNGYIAYSYVDGGVTHTGESGGSTAKALVLAQRTGGDVHNFGGVDLVDRLESLVDDNGRVISTADGAPDASYDNTYIQALAAEGLRGTGSATYADVVGYLLDQQCPEGYFRGDIKPAAQPCDGDAPDPDSTSQAILALAADQSTPGVQDAVAAAESWLLDAQRPNGSFGGGVSTKAPNTNSTGLAGWALGTLGDTQAATDAAAWVRAHQAANVANCVSYDAADLGTIAYDNAALEALQAAPIDATTQDQFRRAVSQALPVLQWAPTGSGDPQVLFAAEYVKAGGFKPVGVIQATPGEALCAMLGEQSVIGYADADGEAHLPVLISDKTRTTKVKVANATGTFGTAQINALGAKTLPVSLKGRVAKGQKQKIKVTGLAPGEMATVRVLWPMKHGGGNGVVATGQANGQGGLAVSFTVPKAPGKAKVKVTGQFANRKASKTFTITS